MASIKPEQDQDKSKEILPARLPWQETNTSTDLSNSRLPFLSRIKIAWGRAIRWEFWPAWLFYIPIVIWIILLGIRYRSPTLFTAANPGLEYGGLVGEQKHLPLLALQNQAPEFVANCQLLSSDTDLNTRIQIMRDFAKKQGYPVVLKPNIGQRGLGVFIARNDEDACVYLSQFPEALILQRYVEGEEYGVFVAKIPNQQDLSLISIVHKSFPHVTGDGRKNLKELILENDRTQLIAPLLLKRWQEKLYLIPAIGERVTLVEIGSHCRGSLFEDANHLKTHKLSAALLKVVNALPEYHFGRIDLRAPSTEHLQRGEDLQVMEINGVSAESAHIYQPGYSLLLAYRDMFRQWSLAFSIAAQNRKNGANVDSMRVLWQAVRDDFQRGSNWF